MISVTTKINREKIDGFNDFAERKLRDLVHDGTQFGETTMSVLVPRGRTHRLADAVESEVSVVSPSKTIGTVGINQAIAPHARYVDEGTGIDGPFGKPISITRPSRKGNRPGQMTFQKQGEPRRYRRVVKAEPSNKILAGKNFSGDTYDLMVDWTRFHTSVLAAELTLYWGS